MAYNHNIHHRRSIRLQGYDYSNKGVYFVTLCTKNRVAFFGNIVGGIMVLNNAGCVANKCWNEIPDHFKHAVLHEYIIMPDHVHGIIEIIKPPGTDYYAVDANVTNPVVDVDVRPNKKML